MRPSPAWLIALTIVAGNVAAQDDPVVEYLPPEEGERKPLHTVVPAYPEKARRARVEGEVEVCFEVDRNGKTRRVAVRRSTNLRSARLDAAWSSSGVRRFNASTA